jgi:hypothetical protein
MTIYKKLQTPSDVPNLEWFSEFKYPKFQTAQVVGLEIRDCNSILYKNGKGQENNVARAVGTSSLNRDNIKMSIEANGIQIDACPPIILEDGTSIDGFTRGRALKSIGQDKWVYLVVKLRVDCNIEDLKDEIGLGCNNHAHSKPATAEDFEVRLAKWISRQDKTPHLHECMSWWNNINHSFTQTIVENRCKKVLKNIKASINMVAFNKKDAEKFASEILKTDNVIDNYTHIVAINNCKTHYVERAFTESMKAIASGKKVFAVGFLHNVLSENVQEERENLVAQVEELNSIYKFVFQSFAQKCNIENFEMDEPIMNFKGFVPQVMKVEDTRTLVQV